MNVFVWVVDWTDADKKDSEGIGDFKHPERELLIWALLLNRKELAMIFWKLGQDHISCALMAR